MTDRAALIEQIQALLDRRLDADETAALKELLRTDPAARRVYIEAADLRATLRWNHAKPAPGIVPASAASADRNPEAPLSAAGVPMYRKGYEPQPFKLRPHHYALIAASLLVASGLAIYIYSASLTQSDLPDPASPPPVATLIESTGGNLTTPTGSPVQGNDYPVGEYTLASGSAEFMLTNAVNVKLRGDTRMVMRNNMSVALARGNAAFVVPPNANGFAVHLPDKSTIVDLGTAFNVVVENDGVTRLYVLQGHVRLDGVVDGPVELVRGNRGAIIDGHYEPWTESLAIDDASVIETTLSERSPRYTFPVASDDLLQTAVSAVELGGPAVDEGVFGGQSVDSLTNGPNVWHSSPGATHESWSTEDGGSVTWRLDTDAAPWGYDLHAIHVLAGCWPNRIGHLYTLEVERLGDDEFVELYRVDLPDNDTNGGGAFERRAVVERAAGEPLATDVVAIRITFHDDNPHGLNLGQSVFREIDVLGEPAGQPVPEPQPDPESETFETPSPIKEQHDGN